MPWNSQGRRNVFLKNKQSLELEDKRLNSLKLRQCNSFPVFLNCLDTDLISISHESHHQVKNRRFKYEMLWWRKDCRFLPSSTKWLLWERIFFAFVVSFSINSVTLYFNGRNGEHLFSKDYIYPLDKANAISLQFKVLKAVWRHIFWQPLLTRNVVTL